MSGLILPNRFTSQPPASTLVDQAKAKELGVVYLAVANESGMLRDVIGGKDIVNPGGSSTGHTGRVWTFSGAQQSNKAITLTTEDNLFVCARIKATAAQAGVPGAAFGVYNSGAQSGFGVGFSGSNQVGLAWLTNAGAGIDAYSTGALNAWYDVYTNLESASVGKRAWINGRPATTTQGSSVSNWIGGQNEIAVGAQHRPSGFLRNFTGHIEWAAVLILDNAKIDDALSARLYADRFPYNLFESQSRRIWVAAAGGGDATATITGVSGSAQVGTVSTSGNASISLPGASGAGSVGNVVASVSAATSITGVSGTGQVGTTTQSGTANVTAPSAAGTGSVGTVSASGSGSPDGNVTITGIAGAGQVGTVAASGNAAVSLAGVAGTGSVGSITPSVTVSTTITGVSGTGNVGATTQTGAANTTVSSAVGTGLVGTVSAAGTSQNGNAVITGVSGSGRAGILAATAGNLRTNQGGGWETYVAPIRKKTVKEVKKEFELLSYAEVVAEQKTAEIKIQHTQAKIEEVKPVSSVAPFSLAPEIARLKLIIAEEKVKIEALRELETKILIHAKIKKEKEKLFADLAFIAEYLMDEDEYDYD